MDETNHDSGEQGPNGPTAPVPPTAGGTENAPPWPVDPPTDPWIQSRGLGQTAADPTGRVGSGDPWQSGAAGGAGVPPYSGPWQSSWGSIPHWAPPPFEQPPPRRGSWATGLVVVVSVALLLGAGVLIGHGLWTAARSSANNNFNFAPPSAVSPGSSGSGGSTGTGAGGPSDAGTIAAKVDPGLVDVETSVPDEGLEAFGTGMVLTANGEVLTNNHVIEGESTISVTDIGNGKTYTATVVGYSINRDLAILQLQNASGLQTVTLGDSSKVTVGEPVVGIGNAEGAGGTPSYTGGVVTALNQSITASSEFEPSEQLSGLIQSNTDIEEGDSGGPLVNTHGQVLGVDTAASSGFSFQGNAGQSYSIPIDTAVTVAKEIESGQSSSTVHIGATAFLGVEVESTSSSNGFNPFGGGLGIGSGQGNSSQTGVVVASVLSGEPAAQAGIVAGDVITSIGGTTVTSASQLTSILLNHRPGDKVQVTWTNTSGTSQSAAVVLASGPPQ